MSAGRTEPSVSRVELPRPRARTWLLVLGALVSGVCLWFALRRVSFDDVWTSLADARWIWVLPALALTYLTLLLRAIRWRFLFVERERVSTWESAKAVNIGLFFNNILPSRAGEVPRIFALGRKTGISKVEIGGTIVVERCLDVLTVAAAALIAWPFLPDASWIRALGVVCAVIVAGFVLATFGAVLFRQRARDLALAILLRLPFVSDARAAAITTSLSRGVHIVANPRRLVLALIFSALVWGVATLSVFALFPAFDLPLSMSSAVLVIVATSLALTVPSTSGGLGVYEAAVQASLVAASVSASVALSFALVLHAINFVPICLTGVLASWGTLLGRRSGVD
jgi:glycosyltransferase 2 family protein